jgi:hypothetical protein
MDVYAAHIEGLQVDPDYPNNPSGCSLLTEFNIPRDWNDNYGTRVRGYLYAPVTGLYTFWVAGDNDADLLLSTDDNPANAIRIAYNPNINIPPAYQNFNLYPEQRSNPIFLEAGQPYYIEALHQEMGIDDNLTVAWRGAGIPNRSVITGAYLAPYTNCVPSPTPFPVVTNLINDPGFESGKVCCGWNAYGSYSIDSTRMHSGNFAAQLETGGSGVFQIVNGLSSNTSYVLRGWVMTENATDEVYIGVKNFDGAADWNQVTTSPFYTELTLTFTTGVGNTSAEVYCWKQTASNSYVYCDDLSLYRQ